MWTQQKCMRGSAVSLLCTTQVDAEALAAALVQYSLTFKQQAFVIVEKDLKLQFCFYLGSFETAN